MLQLLLLAEIHHEGRLLDLVPEVNVLELQHLRVPEGKQVKALRINIDSLTFAGPQRVEEQ